MVAVSTGIPEFDTDSGCKSERAMLTARELVRAQEQIGLYMRYPWTGDRKHRYTAIQFARDLNLLAPGIVTITNGKPNQMYHARRGAMRVPPYWEGPVKELLALAISGCTYPPTPRIRSNHG